MIERDVSEYPSLYSWAGWCVVSMVYVFYMGLSVQSVGLLLIIWGFFVVLRCLWMMEGLRGVNASGDRRSLLLPWIILNEMGRRARRERANVILQSFNKSMVSWLGLIGAYVLMKIYYIFWSIVPIDQSSTHILIDTFFAMEGLKDTSNVTQGLIEVGGLIVIGLSFFCIQTYAYINKIFETLFGMFFLCFVFIHGQFLFTPEVLRLDLSWRGADIFLYLAFGFLVSVFYRAFLNDDDCRLYSSAGLGVLGVLAVDYVFVSGSFILWFSGWSMVAILWSRLLHIAVEKGSA